MAIHFARRVIVSLLALGLSTTSVFAQDTLDKVQDTGKLVVGIKVDYKPYGFRNESGEAVGLEHDLVADLERRLDEDYGDIEVEKVPVTAQNRMQFVQQGKIDLMIATMNDKAERREIVDIIVPQYYSSGVNVLSLKSHNVEQWEDLGGKDVCTLQGAWYNKPFAQEYGLTPVPFAGTAEAEQAVLDKRCFALLYDDSLINSRLQDKERWGDFVMPLETKANTPWGMAIRHGNPKFYAYLAKVSADWHRTGLIAELEEKWDIPVPNAYIKMMHSFQWNTQ